MLIQLRYVRYLLTVVVLATACQTSAAYNPADFAKDNTYLDAKISPDGKHLGVVVLHEGRRRLAVLDLKTMAAVGGADLGGHFSVGEFYWVSNQRIVMEMLEGSLWEAEPKFYGELFAVDYNGRNSEIIYGFRAGEKQTGTRLQKKESVRGWAEVISLLPEDKKHILISSTPQSDGGGIFATVHKLNVHNGHLGKVEVRSPVPYADFIADSSGKVRFVKGIDEHNNLRVYRLDNNNDWQEITGEYGPDFEPLRLDGSGDQLFFLDTSQGGRVGLYKLNLLNGEREHVYTDEQVDISNIKYTSDRSGVYALRIDPGYPTYVMFNDAGEESAVFKQLLQTFAGYKLSITSRSADNRLWLLYASNDVSAGAHYLYDREAQSISGLMVNQAHLRAETLAVSKPIEFQASDGLSIPGYLTLPQTVDQNKPAPLVVLVHGGPHGVRDYWTFDRQVQLLANQGLAVLRVNYRGSGGYGVNFKVKGYRQWGGRMLQDIIEGTQWAATQPGIDPNRIAIMGGSFGGYAAVQAATQAPDLYRCVVANAGVYDLEMMYNEGDIPERLFGKSYLTSVLGSDIDKLRAFSPVHNADKLQAKLLIAHGTDDRRVPIEHAQALRKKLDEHQKEYQWFVKKGEGHGYFDEQNRQDYYETVTRFLSQHL